MLGVLAAASLCNAAGAGASQQQNANAHVYWNWTNPTADSIWDVDQDIRVLQWAPSTYFASNWSWGYMGMQSNAPSFHGVKGKVAIFSGFLATQARGSHCGAFALEPGLPYGMSCRVSYTVRTGRYYRLRVWRIGEAYEGPAMPIGEWWSAYIEDTSTRRDTWIGDVREPVGTTSIGDAPTNFSEYFGPAVAHLDQVPRSEVDFTQPAANSLGSGVYEDGTTFDGADGGQGANHDYVVGEVTDADGSPTHAARVYLGGVIAASLALTKARTATQAGIIGHAIGPPKATP